MLKARPLDQPVHFYNRAPELHALERGWQAKRQAGQMLLLYGRRRLGKTYLLQRFFAGVPGETAKPHCYFLADQTTAATQRLLLAQQILDTLPAEGVSAADLSVSYPQILRYVAQQARTRAAEPGGRFGLILDEFPYLMQQTPELPSILQAWWDREGIHAPLFVVLCGSQLSTMATLGAENAPLFGRFNAGILPLAPLRYDDVAAFYAGSPVYTLPAEKLTMYGVLGGTPRYHALVDPEHTPAEEIVELFLCPQATLENEVGFLLGSEQIRDPAPYNAVLAAIAQGQTQFTDILGHSGTERGALSFYLKTLIELGWIRREFPFEETSERRALYRIADPFLAFWYRFVQPLSSARSFGNPHDLFVRRVAPFLADYLGSEVFESVCRQWLQRWGEARLGLSLTDAGRWWSRDGQTEIDIVARTQEGTYLFGECKWSRNHPIGLKVYADLLAKVARLPQVRWQREARYALFCVGGFTPELWALAADEQNRLALVDGSDLLPEPLSQPV